MFIQSLHFKISLLSRSYLLVLSLFFDPEHLVSGSYRRLRLAIQTRLYPSHGCAWDAAVRSPNPTCTSARLRQTNPDPGWRPAKTNPEPARDKRQIYVRRLVGAMRFTSATGPPYLCPERERKNSRNRGRDTRERTLGRRYRGQSHCSKFVGARWLFLTSPNAVNDRGPSERRTAKPHFRQFKFRLWSGDPRAPGYRTARKCRRGIRRPAAGAAAAGLRLQAVYARALWPWGSRLPRLRGRRRRER
jgi:hypothetical protein